MKMFIYNFGGYIYESTTAFDDNYRKLMKEAKANGETVTRQVVNGEEIRNEYYRNGCWLDERFRD
jgi:hypothetical protein